MYLKELETLLGAIRTGELSVAQGVERLRDLPFENAGVALIDHHRTLRQGVPETILGEGKTAEQIASIVARMAARGNNVLATRVAEDKGELLRFAITPVVSMTRWPAPLPWCSSRSRISAAAACWWPVPAPPTWRWPVKPPIPRACSRTA